MLCSTDEKLHQTDQAVKQKTALKLTLAEVVKDVISVRKNKKEARAQMAATLEKLNELRSVRREGPSTPRPNLQKLATSCGPAALHADMAGTSTADSLKQLVELIRQYRKEKQEAEEALRGFRDKMRDQDKQDLMARKVVEDVKWFVCKGNGPNVPQFLRGDGKVRNRCMPKSECETLIAEYWEAKITRDSRPSAPPRQSVIDFLHTFLQTKSGIKVMVTEIAYNFVDALKRYCYDADCELFHRVT